MHIVDEPMETVHLYVMREEPKRPYTMLPLFIACLCLLAITGLSIYSGEHPVYEHKTLTMPAQFMPPQIFQVSQTIIPTGVKTHPATFSRGILTLSNGSVISQELPANFIISANNGLQVVTDSAVYVPAGNADGYAVATISAHLLTAGSNLPVLAINQVIGSSLYIRNLSPFTGGHPAYSVKVVTTKDKQDALMQARSTLLGKISGLHSPCQEIVKQPPAIVNLIVNWRCQFAQSPHLNIPNARITGVRLFGKNLVVEVMFIAQPQRYRAR